MSLTNVKGVRLSERVPYTLRRIITWPFYALGWSLCWLVLHLQGWRVKTVRHGKVPRNRGIVFVINHPRFEDSIWVGLTARHRLSFLAKSEYFSGRSLAGRLVAIGFWLIWQISTDRSGGRAMGSLEEAAQLARLGWDVGVHGEGTRSKDGRLNNMYTGFVRVAQSSRATVVLVGVVYDDENKLVTVYYSAPIPYEAYAYMTAHDFAELATEGIREMTHQERTYVKKSPSKG